MQDQIRVVVHFEIKPGGLAEFERLARQAVDHVDAHEPETSTYDWYIADDGNNARIYEVYESPEALLTHLMGKVGTEILGPITQVATMTAVDIYGKPSEQLIEAASNFPATVFGERLIGLTR